MIWIQVMDNLLVLTLLLLPHISSTKGTLFQPIAYTFPGGLQSVNGSSTTGGCRESCVMIPISSTINGCDCPGTIPVSGVLIDGDMPSIDTTQRGTWASGLFVVNRNGQDSIVIGFQFSNSFFLRELEVSYLDCPIWGAGVSTINVYSSFIFPSFFTGASTNIGVLSLVGDISQSCTSLTTVLVSISSELTEVFSIFYIEFSFVGGSSVHPLNWLLLGEIRFSDVLRSTLITTASPTSDVRPTATDVSASTEGYSEIISPNGTIHVTVFSNQTKAVVTASTYGYRSATEEEIVSSIEHFFTTGALTASSQTSDVSAVPLTAIIGAFVGIIAILLLLILIGTTLMAYIFVYSKRKMEKLKQKSLEPQYAIIGNPGNSHSLLERLDSTEHEELEMRRTSTALNSLYQPAEVSLSEFSRPVPVSSYQEINLLYSEIRNTSGNSESVNEEADANSDLREDSPENHYAIIPEMYTLASPIIRLEIAKQDEDSPVDGHAPGEGNDSEDQRAYTLVCKRKAPEIPEKSSELQQYLEMKSITDEGVTDKHQVGEERSDTDEVGLYSEIQENSVVVEVNEQPQIRRREQVDIERHIPQISGIEMQSLSVYAHVDGILCRERDDDLPASFTKNHEPMDCQLP